MLTQRNLRGRFGAFAMKGLKRSILLNRDSWLFLVYSNLAVKIFGTLAHSNVSARLCISEVFLGISGKIGSSRLLLKECFGVSSHRMLRTLEVEYSLDFCRLLSLVF